MTLLDLKGIAVLKHRDITKKRKRISIYFRNKPLKPVDAADKLFGIFFLISSDLYCIVLNVLNVFKILH